MMVGLSGWGITILGAFCWMGFYLGSNVNTKIWGTNYQDLAEPSTSAFEGGWQSLSPKVCKVQSFKTRGGLL